MFKEIITENDLKCSEDEFKAYMENVNSNEKLTFNSKVYEYTEQFEGHDIPNETGQDDAVFYFLGCADQNYRYLQTNVPGEATVLTKDNVDKAIEDQKADIEKEHNASLDLAKTIEHFKGGK